MYEVVDRNSQQDNFMIILGFYIERISLINKKYNNIPSTRAFATGTGSEDVLPLLGTKELVLEAELQVDTTRFTEEDSPP